VFGDSAVTPVRNGDTLQWTLKNLGQNFKLKLRYSVMLQRPAVYDAVPMRSYTSGIKYYAADSVMTSNDTLTTTNEAAIAVRGRAVNFIMSGVLFDVGKATLRSTALSSLETTAKYLKDDTSATAMIEGHTDSSPIKTKEFPSNIELSQARANTIKEKLVNYYGIAPERLKTIGYGEHRPLASNATSEGRQVNRRIELRILRSEFSRQVLPEGRIDSSKRMTATLMPSGLSSSADSVVRNARKERYIVTIGIRRAVQRNTEMTVVLDSIPAALSLIQHSPTIVSGIDSMRVDGQLLTAYASAKDSLMRLYYVVEVADEQLSEEEIRDGFIVRKQQTDGKSTEDRSDDVSVRIRKKRSMNLNQQ
jgi:outer membrane protein OmpA-like peptidoglycan-associated protein